MPTTQVKTRVRFGVFELDVRSGELRKSGLKIKLQPQPLQVLLLLLERPGELFTREELRQKLWQADIFVDFERSLNKAVVRLRESLGDSAESPRYIETLPRLGYRFIAPVQDISGSPTEATPAPSAPEEKDKDLSYIRGGDENPLPLFGQAGNNSYAVGQTGAPETEGRRDDSLLTKRWPLLLAGASLLAIAVLLLSLDVGVWRERLVGRAPQMNIHSIAVLPLENLSADPNQEYFTDGMTDELITDLAKIGSLRVISRTSVMQYKGTRKPLPQIAKELNVDAIIEGSVASTGNRVRIRAQLIQALGERHLWAESYEDDTRDILTLQNKVARTIAEQVRAKLTPQEMVGLSASHAVNPEAHEAYLKGRYFFAKRTSAAEKKSVEYFREATRLDPDYALAYAGLSDALAALNYMGAAPAREIMPQARAAAMQAVRLDDSLGEAYVALGTIAMSFDWDGPRAEQEFKRGIELNPNNSEAHQFYAWYLDAAGRLDDAVREAEQARQLDPLSLFINRDLGRAFSYAHQYDRAIDVFRQTIELDPNYPVVYEWLGPLYEKKGMTEEAFAVYLKQHGLDGASPDAIKALQTAYASSGMRGYWRKVLETLKDEPNKGYQSAYYMAKVYAHLGNKDQALRYLKDAYDSRSFYVIWLNVDPVFDNLRSDPRFQDLIRRVGVAR